MSETTEELARRALDRATAAEFRIESHEDLCAERYAKINDTMAEMKGFLKWAGTSAFGVIIALLGFLALQVYNSNEAAKAALATNAETLRQQISDLRSHPHP